MKQYLLAGLLGVGTVGVGAYRPAHGPCFSSNPFITITDRQSGYRVVRAPFRSCNASPGKVGVYHRKRLLYHFAVPDAGNRVYFPTQDSATVLGLQLWALSMRHDSLLYPGMTALFVYRRGICRDSFALPAPVNRALAAAWSGVQKGRLSLFTTDSCLCVQQQRTALCLNISSQAYTIQPQVAPPPPLSTVVQIWTPRRDAQYEKEFGRKP